jgi:hypothetical protein
VSIFFLPCMSTRGVCLTATYEIRLLCFYLLWNFNRRLNPISRLVLSLFLLLPPVFSRLDVFYGSSID